MNVKLNQEYTHKVWGNFQIKKMVKNGDSVDFHIENIHGGKFIVKLDEMRQEKNRIKLAD